MVLVTGGTGLVGAHLLLKLLKKGCAVRATYRKDSDLQRVKKVFGYYEEDVDTLFDTIEWVEADLNDIAALETAFTGIDRVYHTAALISFDPGDYKRLYKTNTEGTANIANLCIDKKIKKLCYVSTIGAIGNSPQGQKAREENPWTPQDANVYARTKQAAEMEVWRASQEGIDVVMVNPGVIIGPGFWENGSGALFGIAQKQHRFYPPGGTGFVSVGDVVEMMAQLMDSNIKNERYIAVAENWTYREIMTQIAQAMGLKPPSIELRPWQLEIGRWFDYTRNLLFKTGRRITKNSVKSLKHREIYDNSKARDDLDFQFEPLGPVIRFCCEKFSEENP
ncbi:NAD-dependent epimerase/dehydratase family protein [Pseudozobellia thermophila]|uniref:Nucleoside-diphosphate-sugar epimerase n=1 Tax=Pseudozobellia thermophila TaxID=192903 RepID=A0A1M6AGP1_9FLAO|nr:NAD-dependent epimerase/dehydratase family protein [Pseudozobellia thermophila]SHI35645.1 Nucleoside-diphosphate-sugar epimerase [Pseudozobellia thermophila]